MFDDLAPEIIAGLTSSPARRLGREFHWIHPPDATAMRASPAFRFVSWNLPVHHAWPCSPQDVDSFVEKAARALARKFAHLAAAGRRVGPLETGHPRSYHRSLASNLRGRLLQLLPDLPSPAEAERQDPARPSLFCLVGREGLFCGIQSPRDSNGFFPGGTRFIRHSGPASISRAGAKLAEALVIFTLKLTGADSIAAADALLAEVIAVASRGGLRWLAQTHLTYNRREFTLFFEHAEPG